MKMLAGLAQAILPGAFKVIDDAIEDKDLALKLKADLQLAALNGALVETQAARDIIVAEAQGESWLQRSWRPITMLVFVFIIFNNYVLVPYFEAFGGTIPTLEIPNGMWALLNVGIGGYIAGRSAQDIARTLANKPKS